MNRAEMAALARQGCDVAESALCQGARHVRIVVIVADFEGEYIGVAGNIEDADRDNVILCAALAEDRINHVRAEVEPAK